MEVTRKQTRPEVNMTFSITGLPLRIRTGPGGFPSGPRPRQRSPACPGRSGLYVPPPRTLSSTHTRQSRVSSHLACKAGFSSRYFSKFGEKQVSHSGFTISLSKVTMSNIKTPIFFIEHLQKVIGNMSFSS